MLSAAGVSLLFAVLTGESVLDAGLRDKDVTIVESEVIQSISPVDSFTTAPEIADRISPYVVECKVPTEVPWYQDFRTLLAVLSAVVVVAQAWYSRQDRREDRRRSIYEDFWLKSILAPLCMKPLIKFAVRQDKELIRLGELANGDYLPFSSSFQRGVASMRTRAQVLRGVDNTLYEAVSAGLESIEDDVVQYASEPRNRDAYPRPEVAAAVGRIVSELIVAQKRLH